MTTARHNSLTNLEATIERHIDTILTLDEEFDGTVSLTVDRLHGEDIPSGEIKFIADPRTGLLRPYRVSPHKGGPHAG